MTKSPSRPSKKTFPKQSFIDKFRHAVKKDKREWDFRFRHAGYRLLLSYGFYASVKRNVEEKSILLSIIGLYYSQFHLIAALMCVDPYLKFEQLPRFPLDHYRAKRDGLLEFYESHGVDIRRIKYLSHKTVRGYASHIRKKDLISEDFFDSFLETRDLRFQVNYAPAYFGYLKLDKHVNALTQRIRENIDEANKYIFTLNEEYVKTAQKHEMGWHPHDYLESFIGDAIGDDFTQNYLNGEETATVFKILESAI